MLVRLDQKADRIVLTNVRFEQTREIFEDDDNPRSPARAWLGYSWDELRAMGSGEFDLPTKKADEPGEVD